MKDKLGCCGLNCEKCDAKLATVNDDDELRKKTSKLWSSLNGVDIAPEMINCYGCRSGGVKTYFCENLCAVRKCVSAKKYQTCADCLEMRKCIRQSGSVKQFVRFHFAVGKTERRNLKVFAFFMRSNPKRPFLRKLNKRVQNVFVLLELIFSILCFFC